MEIEKRIEVAKLFIAKLAEICGGDRGVKITAPAKVWQSGNKVRVYGLARQGYIEVLEDGTVRNEINRPFIEIFEAIDAVAAELTAPAAEETAEHSDVMSDGSKIDSLLDAACISYVGDGESYRAIRKITEITILDLFRFSGLTTAAWCEGLTVAKSTWYKYRNNLTSEIPADRMEDAWVLAMETRAATKGLQSVGAARHLRKVMELLSNPVVTTKR